MSGMAGQRPEPDAKSPRDCLQCWSTYFANPGYIAASPRRELLRSALAFCSRDISVPEWGIPAFLKSAALLPCPVDALFSASGREALAVYR